MIRRSSGQVFFFKQKTAYEMRISDWSSDVCSSDLQTLELLRVATGQKSYAVRTNAHGISAVVINGVGAIPTDRSGRIYVRFGPHAEERFVSAADVLSARSEEHTSELQSLMRNSYAVFCLQKKKQTQNRPDTLPTTHR